jgi:hypothetical protein
MSRKEDLKRATKHLPNLLNFAQCFGFMQSNINMLYPEETIELNELMNAVFERYVKEKHETV